MEHNLSNKEFNDMLKNLQLESVKINAVTLSESPDRVDEVLATLGHYWKVIKPILKAARAVTPPKVDKGINEFIAIVDRLCGGATGEEQSALLEKFAMVWALVRPIMLAAKEFTPPKADLVLDQVIEIGDMLSKS